MLYRKEDKIFRNSIGTLIESISKAYINLNGRPTEKNSSGHFSVNKIEFLVTTAIFTTKYQPIRFLITK